MVCRAHERRARWPRNASRPVDCEPRPIGGVVAATTPACLSYRANPTPGPTAGRTAGDEFGSRGHGLPRPHPYTDASGSRLAPRGNRAREPSFALATRLRLESVDRTN